MKSGSPPPTTIDDYLALVSEPARTTLEKIRAAVRSASPPDATEAIGYGIPMFRYKGCLVAFAAFKKHCSFFPMSLAVMASLKTDLKPYDVDKGTIRFPLDKPLPANLVRKIVKARVTEKKERNRRIGG